MGRPMNRRTLVSMLFFIDQLPPSPARWELEWIIIRELAMLNEQGSRSSGVGQA